MGRYFSLFFVLLLLLGCNSTTTVSEEEQKDSSFEWNLPKGIYPPIVPATNPMTNEKVLLGRYLFYDKNLSANQTQSCATCHLQKYAFSDKNSVGIGSTGEHHTRNPQSLVNAAYYTSYTWANPSLGTLESQIIIPLTSDDPIEMGIVPEFEEMVLARFENNETYQKMFHDAFADVQNPIKIHYIVHALASFIRTLNSFNSPYDRYTRGEYDALTAQQKFGMQLFNDERGECFHCHGGDHFSDSTADAKSFYIEQFYHNIGLYNVDGSGSYPEGNQGLYELTYTDADRGKFKAPILRNVALGAPYMHDGSMQTLEEVIELHSQGGRLLEGGQNSGDGRLSPLKHDFISQKNFTQEEKEALVAFLNALTDQEFITNPNLSDPFKEQK